MVDWINSQTAEFRAGITHVAIDMSATYAKAVRKALPHARIVVDHFHVVKLANQMIDDVRRRTTQALRSRRGRACDLEWTSRARRLQTGRHASAVMSVRPPPRAESSRGRSSIYPPRAQLVRSTYSPTWST